MNGLKANFLEVVFLHFEVWVADLQVFDVRFGFSMSKSPRGQVLSRFRWIGAGFIRVEIFIVFCLIRSWSWSLCMGRGGPLLIYTLYRLHRLYSDRFIRPKKEVNSGG